MNTSVLRNLLFSTAIVALTSTSAVAQYDYDPSGLYHKIERHQDRVYYNCGDRECSVYTYQGKIYEEDDYSQSTNPDGSARTMTTIHTNTATYGGNTEQSVVHYDGQYTTFDGGDRKRGNHVKNTIATPNGYGLNGSANFRTIAGSLRTTYRYSRASKTYYRHEINDNKPYRITVAGVTTHHQPFYDPDKRAVVWQDKIVRKFRMSFWVRNRSNKDLPLPTYGTTGLFSTNYTVKEIYEGWRMLPDHETVQFDITNQPPYASTSPSPSPTPSP